VSTEIGERIRGSKKDFFSQRSADLFVIGACKERNEVKSYGDRN